MERLRRPVPPPRPGFGISAAAPCRGVRRPSAGRASRSVRRRGGRCPRRGGRPGGGKVAGGEARVGADGPEPLADEPQTGPDRVVTATGSQVGGPALVEGDVAGRDALQVPGVADHQLDVGGHVGPGVEDLDVVGEPELRDDTGDVDVPRGDPQPAVQGPEPGPRQPRAQVVALAFPGVGEGETEQGPGAVPVVVDRALLPDAGAAVPQDACRLLGETEVHPAALALAPQQTAVDHAGQRGTYGLFTDADPAQYVDDAARVHAQITVAVLQHVVAEEGEHERLRARLRAVRGVAVRGVQDVVVLHRGKRTAARRHPGGRPTRSTAVGGVGEAVRPRAGVGRYGTERAGVVESAAAARALRESASVSPHSGPQGCPCVTTVDRCPPRTVAERRGRGGRGGPEPCRRRRALRHDEDRQARCAGPDSHEAAPSARKAGKP